MRNATTIVKVLLAVCAVLYTISFLAGGLFILLADLDAFSTWVLDDFVHSLLGKVVGVGMVLLALGSIALRILNLKKEQYIVFDNPDGRVIIAIKAIEDFIRRLTASFSEIKETSPAITPMDDGVDVELKLVLWDDENVHVAVDKIKSVMSEQIQNFFGVANIHSIDIYVTKTVPREGLIEKKTSDPEYNE